MATEASGDGKKGGSETARNAAELQAEIETLKEDLAALTTTLSNLMRSGVREGRGRFERKAEEYKKQGLEQADAAFQEARAYGDALEERIVQNPFSAVLVALGLGFLVGLMSRK
jgi:ElaB/YqjD/DUF883 family membrane-anchored ribosome-binding protein